MSVDQNLSRFPPSGFSLLVGSIYEGLAVGRLIAIAVLGRLICRLLPLLPLGVGGFFCWQGTFLLHTLRTNSCSIGIL